MNLTIMSNKGFHLTTRYYVFSVQIGAANYCDNYNKQIGFESGPNAVVRSSNAEVAVWLKSNPSEWVTDKFFETNGDSVAARIDIKEVFLVIAKQMEEE